jgi:hypothetical protein
MDEARRFLRYVTPGLTFAVQSAVLVLIINPKWALERVESLKEDVGAGFVIIAFLASGGLGYLFSVFHHTLHRFRIPYLSAIDHTGIVKQLSKAKLLALKEVGNENPVEDKRIEEIDRTSAWVIVTAVWKENLRNDSVIKSADASVTGLTDIMHSAGAARWGAILSLLVGFWAMICLDSSRGSTTAAVVIGSGLIILHHLNYLRIGKLAERIIHQVLSDALAEIKGKTKTSQSLVTLVEPWWKNA